MSTTTASIPESSIVSVTLSKTANSNPTSPVVATITVTRSSRIVGAAIVIGAAILVFCAGLILMKIITAIQHLSRNRRRSAFTLSRRSDKNHLHHPQPHQYSHIEGEGRGSGESGMLGFGKKGKKGSRSGNAMDLVEWEGTPVSYTLPWSGGWSGGSRAGRSRVMAPMKAQDG